MVSSDYYVDRPVNCTLVVMRASTSSQLRKVFAVRMKSARRIAGELKVSSKDSLLPDPILPGFQTGVRPPPHSHVDLVWPHASRCTARLRPAGRNPAPVFASRRHMIAAVVHDVEMFSTVTAWPSGIVVYHTRCEV